MSQSVKPAFKSPVPAISNKLLSNRDLALALDDKLKNEMEITTTNSSFSDTMNSFKLFNPAQIKSFDSCAVRIFYSPKDITYLRLVIFNRDHDTINENNEKNESKILFERDVPLSQCEDMITSLKVYMTSNK